MNIITLTNGKRVANFSSPHEFKFEDGSVLPAVSNEDAEDLKITFIETVVNNKGDIMLSFDLSLAVGEKMRFYEQLHKGGLVDVVFCPLPMITALLKRHGIDRLIQSPFRAIRMTDRINKLVSISKQCL